MRVPQTISMIEIIKTRISQHNRSLWRHLQPSTYTRETIFALAKYLRSNCRFITQDLVGQFEWYQFVKTATDNHKGFLEATRNILVSTVSVGGLAFVGA